MAHVVGAAGDGQQVFIAYPVGAPGVAHPVNAGECVGHKVVFQKLARVRAGDRAVILRRVRDLHHAHIARHGACRDCAACDGHGLRRAGADDAADVLSAGECAFRPVGAHRRIRQSDDAADIVAALARHITVAIAARDYAKLHAPRDAPGVISQRGHTALIRAALQHRLQLVFALILGVDVGGYVVLRVELVLYRDRARDTADVDVARHRAGVCRGAYLAQPHQLNVDSGCICEYVVVGCADGKYCVEHRVRQLVEFLVHGADIVRNRAARPGDSAVEHGDLSADGGDRGGQTAEVGRDDDVATSAADVGQVNAARAGVVAYVRQRAGVAAGVSAAAADGDVDVARRVDGIADVAGHFVQPRGHRAARALRVVCRLVDERAQLVELLLHLGEGAVFNVEVHVRLHLPDDAAHVLAPVYLALVRAACHEAAAAPRDAADVVADVLIADYRLVDAAADNAGGVPGNAARVGGGVHRVARGELCQIHGRVDGEILYRERLVPALGVDVGGVAARGDEPKVIPNDAARHFAAENRALGNAGLYAAVYGVLSGNRAGVHAAVDRACEAAGGDAPVVHARNAADSLRRAGDVQRAGYGQITHSAARAYHAEQPRAGVFAVKVEIAYRVPVAVECAVEVGDGGERRAVERYVAVQLHGLPLRPCVVHAVCRERDEIIRRGYVYRVVRVDGNGERHREDESEQRGHRAFCCFIHSSFPPRWRCLK